MGKSTKSGKSLNPTDAYRKEQRKKELKKNKKTRAIVRENALVHKDHNKIKDQIGRLEVLEDQGKLDKRLKVKKKQLEDTYDAVLKKKQELEKINPDSSLLQSMHRPQPLGAPPYPSDFLPPGYNPAIAFGGLPANFSASAEVPLDLPLPAGPPPQTEEQSALINIPIPAGPPPGIPPPPPKPKIVDPNTPNTTTPSTTSTIAVSVPPTPATNEMETTSKGDAIDTNSLTSSTQRGLIPPPPPPRQGMVPPPPPPRAPAKAATTAVLPTTLSSFPLHSNGPLPSATSPNLVLPSSSEPSLYFNPYQAPYPPVTTSGYFPPSQPYYNLPHPLPQNVQFTAHPVSLPSTPPKQPFNHQLPQKQSQAAITDDDEDDDPNEFHAGMVPAALRIQRYNQPRMQPKKRKLGTAGVSRAPTIPTPNIAPQPTTAPTKSNVDDAFSDFMADMKNLGAM